MLFSLRSTTFSPLVGILLSLFVLSCLGEVQNFEHVIPNASMTGILEMNEAVYLISNEKLVNGVYLESYMTKLRLDGAVLDKKLIGFDENRTLFGSLSVLKAPSSDDATDGILVAAPSVTGETAVALDENLNTVWTATGISGSNKDCPPVVTTDEQYVILKGFTTGLYVLEAATGVLVWEDTVLQANACPALSPDEDILYVNVGSSATQLFALDLATGDTLDSSENKFSVFGGPGVDADWGIFVYTTAGLLFWDPSNFTNVTQYETEFVTLSSPNYNPVRTATVVDNMAAFGSNRIVDYNLNRGQETARIRYTWETNSPDERVAYRPIKSQPFPGTGSQFFFIVTNKRVLSLRIGGGNDEELIGSLPEALFLWQFSIMEVQSNRGFDRFYVGGELDGSGYGLSFSESFGVPTVSPTTTDEPSSLPTSSPSGGIVAYSGLGGIAYWIGAFILSVFLQW